MGKAWQGPREFLQHDRGIRRDRDRLAAAQLRDQIWREALLPHSMNVPHMPQCGACRPIRRRRLKNITKSKVVEDEPVERRWEPHVSGARGAHVLASRRDDA